MASFQVADGLATAIYNKIKNTICNLIYPVGSIKMTVTNTNPSTYLGGTWSLWGSGRVPVGIDTSQEEFSTVEKTGGEKTHTLTINEMPSHKHTQNYVGVKWYQHGTSGNYDVSSALEPYRGTDKTGGDKPHNNLQPYITCYMWKRTA